MSILLCLNICLWHPRSSFVSMRTCLRIPLYWLAKIRSKSSLIDQRVFLPQSHLILFLNSYSGFFIEFLPLFPNSFHPGLSSPRPFVWGTWRLIRYPLASTRSNISFLKHKNSAESSELSHKYLPRFSFCRKKMPDETIYIFLSLLGATKLQRPFFFLFVLWNHPYPKVII